MKKKLITTAVLAGIAGTSQAVNVNNDGLGEVLLYSYYNAEQTSVSLPTGGEVTGAFDTLVSVYNTLDEVKAIKVRFLEGKNSREVLDFNLYLSPFDVWTAAITRTADGARLVTSDNSCTVPAIPAEGVDFRNFRFSGAAADGEEETLDRTREGHIEIIEMGVVSGPLAAAATHGASGTPIDCNALVAAWGPGGVWDLSNGQDGVSEATGGLAGRADLVNVQFGAAAAYPATALESFWPAGFFNHSGPGETIPSLDNAEPRSLVFYQGDVVESLWLRGIDAVSAVLMHNNVINEYVLDDLTSAATSWIVTFPTKSFYVNVASDADVLPPFTRRFTTGGACEDANVAVFDREEQGITPLLDFSPPRPGEGNVLCWETNIIAFNDNDRLASDLVTNIDLTSVGFQNGWMGLGFDAVENQLSSLGGETYIGLPVIGFALTNHLNGQLQIGGTNVLANYALAYPHKFTRSIVTS